MKNGTSNLKKILICGVMLIGIKAAVSQDDGAMLFRKNCGVCHSVGKGKIVGPDLKDVGERYKEPWLMQWIKSSQSMVKKKDAIAVEVFNKSGGIVMPDQALSDPETKSILAFIKEESGRLNAPATAKAPQQSTNIPTPQVSSSVSKLSTTMSDSDVSLYSSVALNVFLIIVVLVLCNVIKNIAAALKNE